jgi:hypothetical protein
MINPGMQTLRIKTMSLDWLQSDFGFFLRRKVWLTELVSVIHPVGSQGVPPQEPCEPDPLFAEKDIANSGSTPGYNPNQ